MNELRDVVGFEQYYAVSSDGRIIAKPRTIMRSNNRIWHLDERELKPHDNGNGYLSVLLYDENHKERKYVHRLVAEAFIPNPDNLPQINHKDENKKNNSVENLEWCTCYYNLTYGTHLQRVADAQSMPVLQFTDDGIFVNRFKSAMDASRQTGIPQRNISTACSRTTHYANGFIWILEKDIFNALVARKARYDGARK